MSLTKQFSMTVRPNQPQPGEYRLAVGPVKPRIQVTGACLGDLTYPNLRALLADLAQDIDQQKLESFASSQPCDGEFTPVELDKERAAHYGCQDWHEVG